MLGRIPFSRGINLKNLGNDVIINLIGPPGVGKSTFAAKYVLEHPEFKFCPIDEYRITYEDEKTAWGRLLIDLVENENVILETCGLNHQLTHLYEYKAVKQKHMYTIAFYAAEDSLKERIMERQLRPVPFTYTRRDEMESARWVMNNLNRSTIKTDHYIWTDRHSIDETYEILSKKIAKFRIEKFGEKASNCSVVKANVKLTKLGEFL